MKFSRIMMSLGVTCSIFSNFSLIAREIPCHEKSAHDFFEQYGCSDLYFKHRNPNLMFYCDNYINCILESIKESQDKITIKILRINLDLKIRARKAEVSDLLQRCKEKIIQYEGYLDVWQSDLRQALDTIKRCKMEREELTRLLDGLDEALIDNRRIIDEDL